MLCDGPRRYPLPMNPARARGLIGACQTSPRAYGILWPDGSHSKSPRVHGLFLYSSTPRASATVPVHGPPRYRSTLPRTSDVALNSCGPATTTSPIPTPTPHVLECGVELDEEVQPGATVSALFVVDEASGGRGVYRVSDCNTIRECLCEQPIDRLDGLGPRSFWLASLAP